MTSPTNREVAEEIADFADVLERDAGDIDERLAEQGERLLIANTEAAKRIANNLAKAAEIIRGHATALAAAEARSRTAGAADMRERAAQWHGERAVETLGVVIRSVHQNSASSIRALPLSAPAKQDALKAERDTLNRLYDASRKIGKQAVAEHDALKAEVARLRLAIEEIARQHTYDECDEDEQENGDVIGAYDHAIRRARAALSERQEGGT